MRFGLAVTAVVAVASLCEARPAAFWTYEKLTEAADLVVIATPTETSDKEKTVLPFTKIPAVGIETKFQVLVVLKGDKKRKELVLYHLRQARPENIPNGPQLIALDVKGRRRYLLFLKREADGRFVSATGQMDAAVGVKDLGFYP